MLHFTCWTSIAGDFGKHGDSVQYGDSSESGDSGESVESDLLIW